MKTNLRKSIIILLQSLVLFFSGSYALAAQDMEKFEVWMDILQKSTEGAKNGSRAVEKLREDPRSRIAAFNLQALGKLYGAIDSDFNTLKVEFKKIEDGLGAIDKWEKIDNQKNKDKATKDFAKLLEKENWIKKGSDSKMAKIKEGLKKALKKLDNADEQLIGLLSDQLDKVESTKFDFSVLEEGNGLHEFRRQIRWFMIEAQVLNGLITFKKEDKSCPISEYEELLSLPIAKSKYSTLADNPSLVKTCEIPQCYFVALSDAVEKLGAIKDDAEKAIGNTDSDKTPKDLAKAAEEISDQIYATKLLKKLQSEIDSCI